MRGDGRTAGSCLVVFSTHQWPALPCSVPALCAAEGLLLLLLLLPDRCRLARWQLPGLMLTGSLGEKCRRA